MARGFPCLPLLSIVVTKSGDGAKNNRNHFPDWRNRSETKSRAKGPGSAGHDQKKFGGEFGIA